MNTRTIGERWSKELREEEEKRGERASAPPVAHERVLAEERAERGELLGDALEEEQALAGRALVRAGGVVQLERVGRVEAEHLRLVRQERDVHLLERLDAPRRRRLGELSEELVRTRCTAHVTLLPVPLVQCHSNTSESQEREPLSIPSVKNTWAARYCGEAPDMSWISCFTDCISRRVKRDYEDFN